MSNREKAFEIKDMKKQCVILLAAFLLCPLSVWATYIIDGEIISINATSIAHSHYLGSEKGLNHLSSHKKNKDDECKLRHLAILDLSLATMVGGSDEIMPTAAARTMIEYGHFSLYGSMRYTYSDRDDLDSAEELLAAVSVHRFLHLKSSGRDHVEGWGLHANFRKDEWKAVDHQTQALLYFGGNVMDERDHALAIWRLGAGYQWESIAADRNEDVILYLGMDVEGVIEDKGAPILNFSVSVPVFDWGEYTVMLELGTKYYFKDNWAARASIRDTYDGEVGEGRDHNDLRLMLGISRRF